MKGLCRFATGQNPLVSPFAIHIQATGGVVLGLTHRGSERAVRRRQVFRKLDRNGNGVLEPAEWQYWMLQVRAGWPGYFRYSPER